MKESDKKKFKGSKNHKSGNKPPFKPKQQAKAKPVHLQKPDPIDEKAFLKLCKTLELELNNEQSHHLKDYLDTLMLWNTRINLVGTLLWRETLAELILDSFYLADFIKSLPIAENPQIWDLGSGAGLPGIPLRMAWKEGDYTLVEAREKRALFMTNFLMKKPLVSTHVFWGRAEKFFAEQKEKNVQADVIVSRAFMPYEELLEFVYPHVKQGGVILLMLNQQLDTAPDLWRIEKSVSYAVKQPTGKSTLQQRYFHALVKK